MKFRNGILAFLIVAAPVSLAAQSRFERIHGDIGPRIESAQAFGSSVPGPRLAPEPTPNQLLYDVIHYTIDIAFNYSTEYVEGSVQLTLKGTGSPLYSLDLNADSCLTISLIRDIEGEELSWSRAGDVLTVYPVVPVTSDEVTIIKISYSGTPSSAEWPGLFFRTYGGTPVICSASEPWSARTWWPCKDYPDDKATYDLYFAVPYQHFAASNGVYRGYTSLTKWGTAFRRYHWVENYPMSTYLASVAATIYTELHDSFVYAPGDTMPVTHYVFPSLAAYAAIDFDITVPALGFYSSIFGLYPFVDEKYGVAVCAIGGGMENQTLTSYTWGLVLGDHQYDYIFVHELAHQWFGDLITCKNWVHAWLNEGFASYAEALWFEHLDGPAELTSYMESKDEPEYWTQPILGDPDNPVPWYYFGPVVYDKGAWVLHMLRHVTGDSTFFHILQDYCADPRYRFSTAETNDFRAICETRYGSSLGWFFNEWLTRTDRLAYQWSNEVYRLGDGFNVTLAVDQLQDSLYAMPVEFRITTVAGALDTSFFVAQRHEEFHVALVDSVLDVDFDPDHWILCDKNEVVTGGTPAPKMSFLAQNFPNPFNPSTKISFWLKEPGHVSLKIYDVSGRLVRVLVKDHLQAGRHERIWDGTDESGAAVASGVYFCRLAAGPLTQIRKMVLLK
jgi:aminopeptidase N